MYFITNFYRDISYQHQNRELNVGRWCGAVHSIWIIFKWNFSFEPQTCSCYLNCYFSYFGFDSLHLLEIWNWFVSLSEEIRKGYPYSIYPHSKHAYVVEEWGVEHTGDVFIYDDISDISTVPQLSGKYSFPRDTYKNLI